LDRDLEDALSLAFQSTLPGQTDFVKLLFAHGANINQRDEYGNPVLRVACRQGSQQLVDCLVEAGADLTAVDCDGYSVIHAAADAQCTGTFASFSGKGVSIHLEDRFGFSALHLAMTHDVFAAFLLNSDCKWEQTSPYPWMVGGKSSCGSVSSLGFTGNDLASLYSEESPTFNQRIAWIGVLSA
jgi:hypothetical protein